MPEIIEDFEERRIYSDLLRMQTEREVETLTARFVDGDIGLRRWQLEMLRVIRRGNINQFVAGRGGNPSALERIRFHVATVNRELAKQWRYLRRLGGVIRERARQGGSLAFLRSRARLYAQSSQAMFWRSAIPVELPQVPRDGQTRCKTNCKCSLRVRDETNAAGDLVAVLVTWQLGRAEHCEDCIRLAREWNPRRFPVDGNAQESSMAQALGLWLHHEANNANEMPRGAVCEIFEVEERELWTC